MMNKSLILLPILAIIVLSGCIGQTETPTTTVKETTTVSATTTSPLTTTKSTTTITGEVTTTTPAIKEFTITAKRFDFTPSTITVNKGDQVKLRITSTDVTHGFAIDEYGINERLPSNQEVVVEFTADKTGAFTFYCSVFCGSGHSGMKGQLIVK